MIATRPLRTVGVVMVARADVLFTSVLLKSRLRESLYDDDTALPGLSMHQTPVLEPSRLREREAE